MRPRSGRWAAWWRTPRQLWWSSLPLRVVVSTLLASLAVLVLGGLLLMQQASDGILQAKRTAATAEAQTALDYAQSSLRSSTLSRDAVDARLLQVALDATNRGATTGQYEVIVLGRSSTIQVSGVLAGDPVPAPLKSAMASEPSPMDKLFVTPTTVHFADGRPTVPGLVVGAYLEVQPGAVKFPIYFVFPETNEVHTLQVLQRATLSVGLLLLLALTAIAALVARTVVGPVRQAAVGAERLASGQLSERLEVRGTDDIAVLAHAMNNMAAELEHKIAQYEELSQMQRQFVSDVSHELRTPLTTVRMAAELIYEGRDELGAVDRRSAELMHDELDRFEALLADLLEISRFDAGAAVLSVDPVAIDDLVRAEVRAERPFAERAGSSVGIEVAGDCTAEVDARRIQRILRNLLTNALEHGEGKPIMISVTGTDDEVRVRVRDHGVGLTEEQASHVFQRFWRADPARARTIGGSGLGLAIALEDAQLHGGTLTATGVAGEGATFELAVPRSASTDHEPHTPHLLTNPEPVR